MAAGGTNGRASLLDVVSDGEVAGRVGGGSAPCLVLGGVGEHFRDEIGDGGKAS